MNKIAIIGSGSFGCALAYILNKNNNLVKIWSYTKEEKDLINNEHKCMYLDNFKLDEKIICSNDYEEVIKDTDYIILVVPSNAMLNTCINIKPYITNQKIILASKGISDEKLLSDFIKDELNITPSVIYGPSHAEQIVKDIPTFVEYSGDKNVKELFENNNFHLTYNEDIIGMEVGASLKNIIAIMVGIAEGLNYESNTISYIITEGLKEIKTIGVALGAKEETFYGLSGLGDLITTSFSNDSRNKRAGKLLSTGKSTKEIETIEGLNNLESAMSIIKKNNLDCKLITSLYNIIYKDKDIKKLLCFE